MVGVWKPQGYATLLNFANPQLLIIPLFLPSGRRVRAEGGQVEPVLGSTIMQ